MKKSTGKVIQIFTDGSCEPNPGMGSWGFIIIDGNTITEKSGFERATTNNRMEMQAVIEALRELRSRNLHSQDHEIKVCVDSEYVAKGACVWIKGWMKKGMRTKNKSPVKNADLWMQLWAECCSTPRLEFCVVKGHAGVYGNELADYLCEIARTRECLHMMDRATKPNEKFSVNPIHRLGFVSIDLPTLI